MLQCDLLRGNNVYMVGSCRAWLLHIIHVSAVSKVGVLQEKCSRQPVSRGNFKFKLKMPPGLAAVAHLLRAVCRHVNAPVVFLCFYFVAWLSRRSRAACRVSCKRSLIAARQHASLKAVDLITFNIANDDKAVNITSLQPPPFRDWSSAIIFTLWNEDNKR